jgi:hypothetical protein
LLALDLARLDDVLGQGLEHGFAAQRQAQGLHAPEQASLPVSDGGKQFLQDLVIPREFPPIVQFMDVCRHNLRTSWGDYAGDSPQNVR